MFPAILPVHTDRYSDSYEGKVDIRVVSNAAARTGMWLVLILLSLDARRRSSVPLANADGDVSTADLAEV